MSTRSIFETCRKVSPAVAAAMSTAVCLSGGNAAAVSGNFSASNAGNSNFVDNVAVKGFNGLASFSFNDHSQNGHAHFRSVLGSISAARTGPSYVRYVGTGITVSGGLIFNGTWMSGGASNTYIPVRFNASGLKFGWIHVVSIDAGANNLHLDTWAYDQTGGSIKTLDESISPKKIALSDGRVKLNWSNANEDGVSRYEVQTKNANGAWASVDSATPGEGSYAATVSSGGEYRLVVENVDGASREIAF